MGAKICIKCGVKQPEENFYWAKGTHIAHLTPKRMNTCKVCANTGNTKRTKAQYARKKSEHALMLRKSPNKTKVCRICKKELKIRGFAFHSTMSDLLSGECMPCRKEQTAVRADKNKAKFDSIDRTTFKVCRKCKEEKPLFDFNKHLTSKDCHRNECISCQKENTLRHREKHGKRLRAERRDWYRNNPEKVHDRHLQEKFGITREDYLMMLAKQEGKCKICGTSETGKAKNFAVDHCHNTNKVRSLLCSTCNTGIGHLKDDPALLRAAANYLDRHKP